MIKWVEGILCTHWLPQKKNSISSVSCEKFSFVFKIVKVVFELLLMFALIRSMSSLWLSFVIL